MQTIRRNFRRCVKCGTISEIERRLHPSAALAESILEVAGSSPAGKRRKLLAVAQPVEQKIRPPNTSPVREACKLYGDIKRRFHGSAALAESILPLSRVGIPPVDIARRLP